MCDNNEVKKEVVVEERYCYEEEIELTVHKTSMFNQGDGFIVYDSKGDIIFRVDTYFPLESRLLLMDTIGKPLLTLLPKRPTLHHRWEGFLGEKSNDHQQLQPIFNMWKSSLIGRSSLNVEIHGGSHATYQIEGCFSERSCTIYHVTSSDHHDDDDDSSKESVAVIKRKVEPTRNIVLGRVVFSLVFKAGYDAAFVMGLVLALDRIDGNESYDDNVSPIECHKDIDT